MNYGGLPGQPGAGSGSNPQYPGPPGMLPAPSSLPPPRPNIPPSPPLRAPSSFPLAPVPAPMPAPAPYMQLPPRAARPPPLAAPVRPQLSALPKEKPEKRLVATISFMAQTVDDEFMGQLLRIFGTVASWKRPKDPQTQAPKSFGFVEYERPESMKTALAVLPGQAIDGKEIQVKASNPTVAYLNWWSEHGTAEAAAAEDAPKEDGEAGAEDAAQREMDAMERVMDLISRRDRRNGGAEDRRGSASDEGGTRRDGREPRSSSRSKHERLEAEFEADRARKRQLSEREVKRQRREYEDLLREVRRAEAEARRVRQRRAEEQAAVAEKRRAALLADNAEPDTEDEEEAGWKRAVRDKEARLESEADEKDRLKELEEIAAERAVAAAAAAAAGSTNSIASGIVDASDTLMAAMLQQAAAKPDRNGSVAGYQAPLGQAGAFTAAGSLPVSESAGGWSSAMQPAAPGILQEAEVPGAKAAAVKKQFFDDDSDKQERKVGAWIIQEAAKRDAAPVADAEVNEAAVNGAHHDSGAQSGAFEAERDALMKRIPKSIEDAKTWRLNYAALKLDLPDRYQGVHKRIAKYVHEVLPEDEEAIASTVLDQVKQHKGAGDILQFCEFLGKDATFFVLKVWRLLIAESEINTLKEKYSVR